MTDEPGTEIRERFRATPLPAAPVRLRERLAAVSASPAATTTSRLGRARLIVALAAAIAVASIGLLVGGGADDPSPGPDGGPWGPLAVANLMAAEAALTHGELLFTDRCAFLVAGDGTRVLLVWPAARTTWDAASRTVSLKQLQTNEVVALREGVPLKLGGGGSSVSEDGQSGEDWAAGFDWVAPPATECLTAERWVISDVAPLTAEATPDVPSYAVECFELDLPALTCGEVVDATLAALGPDHPPISRFETRRLCDGICEPGARSVMVMVTYATPPGGSVDLVVHPGDDGPVVEFVDPQPQEYRITCEEASQGFMTCAGILNAVLEDGAFALDPGSIVEIVVTRHCDEPCDPATEGATVSVVLGPPTLNTVSFSVRASPDGPTVLQVMSDERALGPPYGDEPPPGSAISIEAVALNQARDKLKVRFFANSCFDTYDAWVGGSADRLRVAIIVVPRVEPRPSGAAYCVDMAYRLTYSLGLAEPFQGTIVEDVSNGQTFEVELA